MIRSNYSLNEVQHIQLMVSITLIKIQSYIFQQFINMTKRLFEKLYDVSKKMGIAYFNKNNRTTQFKSFDQQKKYAEEQMKNINKKIGQNIHKITENIKSTDYKGHYEKMEERFSTHGDNLKQFGKDLGKGIQKISKVYSKDLGDGINKFKDTIKTANFQGHYRDFEQKVSQQTQKVKEVGKKQKKIIDQFGKKSQEYIQKNSQKISNAKQNLKEAVSQKTYSAKKLFRKMLLRASLLIIISCFAFGIGSTLPKQIRVFLSQIKSAQPKKDEQIQQAKTE